MNNTFYIKHQDHLKLYVLLKDTIKFENLMNRKQIPFYSDINEQPNTTEGIRYFILDTDLEKVDKLLIENGIIASTETISNYDFRDQKKFYKVYVWAVIIITLLISISLIIEFVSKP